VGGKAEGHASGCFGFFMHSPLHALSNLQFLTPHKASRSCEPAKQTQGHQPSPCTLASALHCPPATAPLVLDRVTQTQPMNASTTHLHSGATQDVHQLQHMRCEQSQVVAVAAEAGVRALNHGEHHATAAWLAMACTCRPGAVWVVQTAARHSQGSVHSCVGAQLQ
jgi:hypothetical protein